MNVFDFFRPAPYVEEIRDGEVVEKKYRYWRWRTFYAMYIGYALFYFTRQSFPFAMPAMQADLGLSKVELGFLSTTILSIAYGTSKFLSGILGDKSNPRYFMSIGLILTGVLNLLFGMSSLWWCFAILWALNGWFQGWGWPGCAKLLTHWYSRSERGRWWSLWNTSHNLGGWAIAFIAPFCAQQFGWRFALYVPGVLAILVGFFIMNRLRDTPQSLGLPAIERHKGDERVVKEKEELSTKEIFWEYVIRNKYIWILSMGQFFIYVIRTAVNYWSLFYLIEVKGYSYVQAGFCVCWFEIGGLCGSLASGWMSDVVFKGKRNPVNVLFNVAIVGLLCAFKMAGATSPIIDALFLFGFGFFIFGPQMLIGMAAAELSHKKAAATATGFAGSFAYLGAAIAGGPLGAVIKNWGWDVYLGVLFLCAALGALVVLPIWSAKRNPKELSVETA